LNIDSLLSRWTRAAVIDQETADRIRAFEEARAGPGRIRWPIWIASAFGAILVGSGVLLFVSAHWDAIGPGSRFALVSLMVAVFHVAGALLTERAAAVAVALHGVGTLALGAGIFLSGQIFNLDEHWPGGFMLWALGAALAWIVLRHAPQLALTAFLAPVWLVSEWLVAADDAAFGDYAVPACGVALQALAYFSAPHAGRTGLEQRTLRLVGGVALLPSSIWLAVSQAGRPAADVDISMALLATGWIVAFGVPLALAVLLRGADAWPIGVAALWVAILLQLDRLPIDVAPYVWWAAGALALVAWGIRESRTERINMAVVIFAATVGAFYFSEVMDKLGRAASLIGFGLLFLAGGWALERTRRSLVAQARGRQS
jgi:uncharacterized membrane protein